MHRGNGDLAIAHNQIDDAKSNQATRTDAKSMSRVTTDAKSKSYHGEEMDNLEVGDIWIPKKR
jgi:hypothetical protein